MLENSPLVSIIMNCHNGEKYLEESVKSIIGQSYKNWELIFWDNVSQDNSKKIINKFSDDRIKYFKSENFKKLYEARNLAIQKANGKFISFIDTDDMWEINKLEKQIEFFLKNKDFEIVYSNYTIIDEKKNKRNIKFKYKQPSGMIFNDLLKKYTVGIGTVCLERKIFKDYSFNSDFDIIGDFDFFLKLSKKKKFGYIHDELFFYRLHDSNLSKKQLTLHANEIQKWIKTNKNNPEYHKNLKYLNFYLFKLKFKSLLQLIFNKLGM
jgi:glycosyltransferase involved in cell wall biosynthesis